MVGVAIFAGAAEPRRHVALHEIRIALDPVGVRHDHGDGHRLRLHQRIDVAEWDRKPLFLELPDERRDHDGGVNRLVAECDAHLRERKDLQIQVGDGQPFALQHLADLIGRDRALAVAGNHLALEVLQALDGVLEVRPQHEIVPDRRRDAVGQHRDRKVLLERIEDAGRNATGDNVVLVLREQRDHVRRGVDVIPLELDAGFLEVAVLQRHQLGGVRCRARDADLDGVLGRGRPAADGEQCREHRKRQSSHDRFSLPAAAYGVPAGLDLMK
jgi:hypothetical protein